MTGVLWVIWLLACEVIVVGANSGLLAEVPVCGQQRVRPGRQGRFERADRRVGHGFEVRVGDAVFDVGVADEFDVDAFPLQQVHEIGERAVRVRDEDRGTRQRRAQERRMHGRRADERRLRAPGGVDS